MEQTASKQEQAKEQRCKGCYALIEGPHIVWNGNHFCSKGCVGHYALVCLDAERTE